MEIFEMYQEYSQQAVLATRTDEITDDDSYWKETSDGGRHADHLEYIDNDGPR